MRGLLAILLLTLAGCLPLEYQQPQRTEPESETSRPLRVGTLYGPTTYVVGAAGAQGLDYELALGFALHLGRELEVTPYASLPELFDDMSQGKLDLIASSLTDTHLNRSFWRFGPPIYRTRVQLVYRRGHPKPDSLAQLTEPLMVMAGSNHAEMLATERRTLPVLSWEETTNYAAHELLSMVASGELAYTLSDDKTLAASRRLHPELAVAFSLGTEQEVGWALPEVGSHRLLSELLDYWNTLKQAGTLKQLEEKYFGHVKRFDYVDTRAFIRAVETKLPKYESWFREHAGELDWRQLAAVAYQESHWNPKARSPTGVRGLMMLTQSTARRVGVTDRLNPEQSIRGGSDYLHDLLKRLPASIPQPERLWFALAAYNIGLGHVEDARVIAQRQGLNPSSWADVKSMLPRLTQKRYYQSTRYGFAQGGVAAHYVDNIKRYYDTLVLLETHLPPTTGAPLDLAKSRE
ncbi:membrane-bound lytic murein transglycosylase MltF [Ferrimonas sediminicola]|uniref:Membrane-bound lytic murein transglycosylase F n=1 Tax=Ferrimonas sediminicola TaxID=2569538 RepID=A0A4U1BLB6_9GAMM|nr:membrane-bound lytic murein transglycosylase MltF [Ferrimonas sediminicola]TKB51594.1 membrane-bound lytic murein transglycosylase MltF [Ferrimonas sediminicola]